LYTSK